MVFTFSEKRDIIFFPRVFLGEGSEKHREEEKTIISTCYSCCLDRVECVVEIVYQK